MQSPTANTVSRVWCPITIGTIFTPASNDGKKRQLHFERMFSTMSVRTIPDFGTSGEHGGCQLLIDGHGPSGVSKLPRGQIDAPLNPT